MISVQEENGNDTGNNYRSCGKRSVQHNKRFGEEKKMRLIDADALGKRITKRIRKKGSFEGKDITELGYAMLCIHEAPTVDAEPIRYGHWIGITDPEIIQERKCSLCHKQFFEETEDYRYCPNCGAKMIGADTETMYYPQVEGITPTVIKGEEDE